MIISNFNFNDKDYASDGANGVFLSLGRIPLNNFLSNWLSEFMDIKMVLTAPPTFQLWNMHTSRLFQIDLSQHSLSRGLS